MRSMFSVAIVVMRSSIVVTNAKESVANASQADFIPYVKTLAIRL